MPLDNLLAKLGLNTSAYDAGLSRAQGAAAKFGSSLKGSLAAAFGGAAMINFTKSLVDGVERIKDLSEQFNITTDDVQRFDYHAKKNGLTMEAFSAGLSKIANLRRSAAKGDSEAIDTLNEFGISLKQATDPAYSMANAIDSVSTSINELGLNAKRTGMITDIFGRSGQRLISTLQEVKQPPPFKVAEADVKAVDQASKEVEVFWSKVRAGAVKALAEPIKGAREKGFLGWVGSNFQNPFVDNTKGMSLPTLPGFPVQRNLQTGAGLTGPTFRNLDAEPAKINKGMDQKLGRLIVIEEDVRRAVQEIAIRGINPLGF